MSKCPVTGLVKNCRCLYDHEPRQVDLKTVMRFLFTEHGVYTAFVLKSIVDGIPDVNVFVKRTLENQKDIGDQLKPIVGNQKGAEVTAVLTEHIKLAGEVMKAAKNKDKHLNQKINKLFDNSDDVAVVLSSLNPQKLPLQDMKDMFHIHNDFVIKMTVARLAKQYQKEQILYDAYYNELLDMADQLAMALEQ